jgi:hypothetical protein
VTHEDKKKARSPSKRSEPGGGVRAGAGAKSSGAADDDGNYFHLRGYVRGWAAFNLQDIPETKGNDKGKMSMLRGSILLDADAATGPIKWKAVAPVDREAMTPYLQDLEDLRKTRHHRRRPRQHSRQLQQRRPARVLG